MFVSRQIFHASPFFFCSLRFYSPLWSDSDCLLLTIMVATHELQLKSKERYKKYEKERGTQPKPNTANFLVSFLLCLMPKCALLCHVTYNYISSKTSHINIIRTKYMTHFLRLLVSVLFSD